MQVTKWENEATKSTLGKFYSLTPIQKTRLHKYHNTTKYALILIQNMLLNMYNKILNV